jgi:hypothetical protein
VAERLVEEEAAEQEMHELMGKAPHGWDKSERGMMCWRRSKEDQKMWNESKAKETEAPDLRLDCLGRTGIKPTSLMDAEDTDGIPVSEGVKDIELVSRGSITSSC